MSRPLTGSEYDFGHTDAQRSVMIDLGEPEVLEWHMPQLLHGIIGGDFATPDLLEQSLQLFRIHANRLASLQAARSQRRLRHFWARRKYAVLGFW